MSATFTQRVPLVVLDGSDDGDNEIEVTFGFVPGQAETPPAYSHGGLPAEPPEFDIHSAFYVVGESLIVCGLADHERQRVEEWLAENWEPPSGAEPDDARDQRRDDALVEF